MIRLRCALLLGTLAVATLLPFVNGTPAQAQASSRRPNMRAAEAALYEVRERRRH